MSDYITNGFLFRRKVAAMGGMSAQIPIKGDEKANEAAMAKVRADKLREVKAGHDGESHLHLDRAPVICKIAMDIFDEHMHGPNQYHVHAAPSTIAPEAPVLPSDLLNHQVVGGKITEGGVKANVEAALAYCAAWVSGNGCVPINYLMEDAATAEIALCSSGSGSRLEQSFGLQDTTDVITASYIDKVISQVSPNVTKIVAGISQQHVDIAAAYLSAQVKREWASDFLTSDLMAYLESQDGGKWVRAAL
ncbi:malate synthase [Ceratobasidium sp. AG-Ba]|nr:malate synthase [Ceratobasidium sp. AG-Ba]